VYRGVQRKKALCTPAQALLALGATLIGVQVYTESQRLFPNCKIKKMEIEKIIF
jgi:hypothetical protein